MDHNMRSTWNFYSPTTWVSSKSPLGKSITASPSSVAKAPLISCSFVRGVCLRGSKTGKQPRGFRTPDTWKSGLPNVSASVLLGGEIMAGNCGSCCIGAASWQRKDRNSWPLLFFFSKFKCKVNSKRGYIIASQSKFFLHPVIKLEQNTNRVGWWDPFFPR